MNYKTRSLRAGIAVALLVLVAFINVDALAHIRVGAEYNYSLYAVVSGSLLALAVVLFAWNAIEYAVKK